MVWSSPLNEFIAQIFEISTWEDERNVPALGRIGDPDDILASVRVEEGKVSRNCKLCNLLHLTVTYIRSLRIHINLCHRTACVLLMVLCNSRKDLRQD